jgi:transcriptional regulator with XRE-family HTH domain
MNMDKKDFGQLVAILRKECRNEFDEPMTQFDLAEMARIPLITLQKIEQGRQENIKPDALLKMANAINLSSCARQVFLLASLGIKDNKILKPTANSQIVLTELTHTLSKLQIPAFILDGFGDIVATNLSGPAIYDIDIEKLSSPHLLTQHNFNRILFSPDFEKQREMWGEMEFEFTRRMVMLFKLWTLKYRNHWYFQRLLPELNRYPVFRQHWQSPTFQNEDIFVQYNCIALKHPKFGLLKFLTTPTQAITTEGDLYLFCFQPLDVHSAQVCNQLAEKLGTQAIRVAPWPKPPTPTSLLASM